MEIVKIVAIGRLVAAIAAVISACFGMVNDSDGWGWFLVAAIILGSITVEELRS